MSQLFKVFFCLLLLSTQAWSQGKVLPADDYRTGARRIPLPTDPLASFGDAAGPHTVHFTAASGGCPRGITDGSTWAAQYLSGGAGTPESVTPTGGTCTSGAIAGGTVIFTTLFPHGPGVTIGSATR